MVSFRWLIDKRGLARIKREQLGRKILFTDNDDWATEAINRHIMGSIRLSELSTDEEPLFCELVSDVSLDGSKDYGSCLLLCNGFIVGVSSYKAGE